MTFDLLLDGRLLARDLLITTVEDFCKLDAAEIVWAIEDCGICTVCDASGDRELALVARDQRKPERMG